MRDRVLRVSSIVREDITINRRSSGLVSPSGINLMVDGLVNNLRNPFAPKTEFTSNGHLNRLGGKMSNHTNQTILMDSVGLILQEHRISLVGVLVVPKER